MKKLFFSLLSLYLSASVFGQMSLQPNVFQSPEISSLMREVVSPVSLSSGTVSTSVPLYTLQKGEIKVPLSLNYDASGVKVDAQPSWVGQNWSLSTGGMISRIVKGVPDEAFVTEQLILRASGNNVATNNYPVGYFYNSSGLSTANWSTTSQIEDWAKNYGCELEPDEFVFNFCGHSGVFYANEKGQLIVKGQKGWKIEPMILRNIPVYDGRVAFNINNPDPRSYTYMRANMLSNITGFGRLKVSRIMGFRVTDPQGVEYYFGQFEEVDNNTFNWYESNMEGIEINADFFSEIFYEEFNGWHLRKIKAPNGDEVTFKYTHFWPTLSLTRNYSSVYMSGKTGSGFLSSSASIYHAGASLSGSILRPVYLSEIRTSDQLITFTSSQTSDLSYNPYTIDNELVYNCNNYADRYLYVPVFYGQNPIRKWNAGGNLVEFISGSRYYIAYNEVRRKKLDRIEVKSLISNEVVKSFDFSYNQSSSTRLQLSSLRENTLPAYQFRYNTTSLPGYLSDQHDHWGYFNNRTPVYNYGSFESYREPNASYTSAGSLTEITYPTGGVKKFVYEPHTYTKYVARDKGTGNLSLSSVSQKYGGGLRIKEIQELDNNSVLLKKSYSYSPGILNGKPEYYWVGYTGRLTTGGTYSMDRFFSQSLLPVSNNPAGGSVSYTTVTEVLQDNGKVEYTFTNHDTRIDENVLASIDPQRTAYSPLTSKGLERGMITEIKYYGEGSSTPLKRETFTYSALNGSMDYIKAVNLQRMTFFGGTTMNAIAGSAYKNYVYPYNVTRKTEYYTHPGNLTQSFDYTFTYDNVNQIKTETKTDNLSTVSTTYKYPYDYSTTVYQNMVTRNIISPVIETLTKNGTTEVERVNTNYGQYTSTGGNIYLPSSATKTSSRSGSSITDQLTYLTYDRKGNPVAARDIDGQLKVFIWGYNGAHVVAEITGVALSTVTGANSSLSGIATTPISGALPSAAESAIRSLSGARVVTYDYKPLVGISKITDVTGRTTTYNYDSLNRLQTVVDSNGHVIEKYEYNYK